MKQILRKDWIYAAQSQNNLLVIQVCCCSLRSQQHSCGSVQESEQMKWWLGDTLAVFTKRPAPLAVVTGSHLQAAHLQAAHLRKGRLVIYSTVMPTTSPYQLWPTVVVSSFKQNLRSLCDDILRHVGIACLFLFIALYNMRNVYSYG